MKNKLDKRLPDKQAGFRKDRSSTDNIATLRMIIEQSVEWNSSLYLTFIDYKKAFDSVDGEGLWRLSEHYGIPEKLITLIKETYDHSTCRVVHCRFLSELIDMLTGVQQGWVLAPMLFLLVIHVDWRMKSTLAGQRLGTCIQWTLTRRTWTLPMILQ